MAKDLFAEAPQTAPRDLFAPETPPEPRPEYLGGEAVAILGEYAAAANRSLTEFLDFIGPEAVNAILELRGSQARVPTLTDFLDDKMSIRGGFMEPGTGRDVVQAAGNTTGIFGGMVPVARNVAKAPGMIAELLGFGTASGATVAAELGDAVVDVAASPKKTVAAAEMIREMAEENSDTAGKMVVAGKIVDDKVGKEGIKQGLGEDLVAMVKAATPAAKAKMRDMLTIVEGGKKNLRYKASNRPLDVAGKSVRDRVDVVFQANRQAARQLETVAENLKGKPVDAAPAVDDFMAELQGLGVKFDPKTGVLDFDGSDIEKLKGPMRVLTNLIDRMRNTRTPDAYDVHRLKKHIDELVSYGKSKKGLSGRVEGILKSLRHNLDGILDDNFLEYNRVNSQYAETRQALDAMQDLAGKKKDLLADSTVSAFGTLTRRVLSNAMSRADVLKALEDLDRLATKYSKPGKELVTYIPGKPSRIKVPKSMDFDDDIVGQVIFADKLDEVAGTHAGTSLQGDMAKVLDRAAVDAVSEQTITGIIREGAEMGIKKARGINEENALKAMRELLERGQ